MPSPKVNVETGGAVLGRELTHSYMGGDGGGNEGGEVSELIGGCHIVGCLVVRWHRIGTLPPPSGERGGRVATRLCAIRKRQKDARQTVRKLCAR